MHMHNYIRLRILILYLFILQHYSGFRLNFYLAADEWRLKVLSGNTPPSKVATSWSEFRREFSMLETSDVDLLGEPYVLFNKPFIG